MRLRIERERGLASIREAVLENDAGIGKKAVHSSQQQRSGSGLQMMLDGNSSPEPRTRGHPPSHTSADI